MSPAADQQTSVSAKQTGTQTYARLLAYLTPYKLALGLMLLGFGISAGTETLVAYLMKRLINALTSTDASFLTLFPLAIIGLFVLRGTGTFLGNYYSALVARNVVHSMRLQVFDHVLKLPMAHFLTESGGTTAAKLVFNVEQVTAAGVDAIKVLVRDGLTVLALVGFLFYTSWQLSLTLFVILPLIGGVLAWASRRFRKLSHKLQDSMGDVSHITTEVISNIDVVKNNSGQAHERARFEAASKNNLRQAIKIVVTDSISTPMTQLLMSFALAAVVWLALRPEALGSAPPGDFVGYVTALGLLAGPIKSLSQVNVKIQRGIAGADSIFTLLDQPAEADQGELTPVFSGKIEFKDVELKYQDGTRALEKINLTVNAGETLAIVGRSGAGKSSLVHLLTRDYEPTSGEILIDGTPINQIKLSALRQQIAIVSQKVRLFAGSIKDNIAYGFMKDKPEDQVAKAAKTAHALEFIDKLPQGLNHELATGGEGLSGGQRQRLSIARSLLKNAPILILDEATSALDNESEHFIQLAIDQLKQGRTTLTIAHRLTSIEHADRIVVMDQGRIVETGTHADLIQAGGLYASMAKRNFEEL